MVCKKSSALALILQRLVCRALVCESVCVYMCMCASQSKLRRKCSLCSQLAEAAKPCLLLCLHTCMYVRIYYTYILNYIYIYILLLVDSGIYTILSVYAQMHIACAGLCDECMCVCVYIYIYIHSYW